EPPRPAYPVRRRPAGNRPGDDFNRRASWDDILIPHGWARVGGGRDEERWCRPGKDHGVSATTDHAGNGLLYVFSSNADPFEDSRGYSKFTAYALLNHEGDCSAAAAALRKQGYGRSGHRSNGTSREGGRS